MKEVVKNNSVPMGYKDLFNEKNYILETIASIVSRFGDGIDTIAFSLLVYAVTGSTLLVATLFAVNGIPNIIFGMISGVACKYVSDKKIMVVCDFGRCICAALIAILFVIGHLEVWHLYVITFLNSSFESFREPASMSIVPKLLPREKIEHGIALATSGSKVSNLIGLSSASIIIGVVGLGGAIFIDAATFLICGLLVSFLRVINTVSDEKATIKGTFNDLKEGFLFVKKETLILTIIIFAMVINAILVPLNALQAPYVDKVLRANSSALSIINGGSILGMIAIGVVAPKFKEKLGGRNTFILGGILMGITYSIMSILGKISDYKLMYIALAINVFLLGAGTILLNFIIEITLLRLVKQEFLPRVVSITKAVALCATPIAACAVGVLSEFISIEMIFMILGVCSNVVFFSLLTNKTIKKFNEC